MQMPVWQRRLEKTPEEPQEAKVEELKEIAEAGKAFDRLAQIAFASLEEIMSKQREMLEVQHKILKLLEERFKTGIRTSP